MELTQEYLKECFNYDPTTGNLIWKERPRGRFRTHATYRKSVSFIGRVAGATHLNGYRSVSLDRKVYYVHRLVWLWHTGKMPTLVLDHINRNPSDNRIENLRECTHALNCRAGRARHSRGFRGVRKNSSGSWTSSIRIGGRSVHLGSFRSAEDAALAYARSAVDHFGKFAPIEAKELFNEAYP